MITWNFNKNDLRLQENTKSLSGPYCTNNCWNMSIKASRTAFKSGGSVSDWMLNGHKYILMTRLNQWPQGIGQMDIKYRIQLHFKTENKIWGSSWSWPSCVNMWLDWSRGQDKRYRSPMLTTLPLVNHRYVELPIPRECDLQYPTKIG